MNFVIKNLLIIHKGSILAKIKAVGLFALIGAPFHFIVEALTGWYWSNYEYVIFVFMAIIIDHILGSWVHLIKRDFSMRKNIKGFIIKSTMVIAVSILAEGFKEILDGNFLTSYFVVVTRLMVFIYPAGSALVNCSIITRGAFPPTAFINKILSFNQNLDLNGITKPKTHEKDER